MTQLTKICIALSLVAIFSGCGEKTEVQTATATNTPIESASQPSAQTSHTMYLEGLNYYNGINGTPVNQVKAMELFQKAADLGHPDAMFFVGHSYEYSSPPDYEKAIEWYTKSMKGGSGATNEAHVKELKKKLQKTSK